MVTGAGGGIGSALALELSALGYEVILLGRNEERLRQVEQQIDAAGGRALCVPADLGQADWRTALAECREGISVLVHAAAAYAPYVALDQLADDEINAVLDINLGAALRLSAFLLPEMKRKLSGHFFFIGSSVASSGGAAQVSYASAKAGLSALVKSLVLENSRYGINANLLELGLFETERTMQSMGASARERFASLNPAGRNGQPEEVAAALRYLLSEEASFLRGTTLTLDGGAGLGLVALSRGAAKDTGGGAAENE